MIPQAALTSWRNEAPWRDWGQVEQDLIISRAITEIFNDEYLASHLAFRGGTALHKLFLAPAMRYSEDIDLVQIYKEPVGPIFDRLRAALAFLGEAKTIQKKNSNKMVFKVDATMPPAPSLKLKVEMNPSEGESIFGCQELLHTVDNSWFSGVTKITTYSIDELLGTKLRALYQRRKGRDLFDLWAALETGTVDPERVLEAFRYYTNTYSGSHPSSEVFMENLSLKMEDDEFLGDINALIRAGVEYDCNGAYKVVCEQLITRI